MKVEIHADYPVYETAKDLVDVSDLIISGRILDRRYELLDVSVDQGNDSGIQLIPYTIYEIQILNVYKGKTEDDTIYIKCVGGINDDVMYLTEINEKIKIGGDYLLLLKTYDATYSSLLNDSQSLFDLGDNDEMMLEILELVVS